MVRTDDLAQKVRCKEVWVRGGTASAIPTRNCLKTLTSGATNITQLSRSPQPEVFVETPRKVKAALTAFDGSLPTNPKVKIDTTKKGKGRIFLTPLDEQPEPPNICGVDGHPGTTLADDEFARYPEGD